MTRKLTVPLATVFFDSVKWNSEGLPAVTFTAETADPPAWCAAAGSPHARPAASAATARANLYLTIQTSCRCCSGFDLAVLAQTKTGRREAGPWGEKASRG